MHTLITTKTTECIEQYNLFKNKIDNFFISKFIKRLYNNNETNNLLILV